MLPCPCGSEDTLAGPGNDGEGFDLSAFYIYLRMKIEKGYYRSTGRVLAVTRGLLSIA